MKRFFASIAVLIVATSLYAGDVAAFVDLGFSKDGKTYIFGQYGKTDGDFHGYAEIYTVDIKKNDFVSNGIFKTVDKSGKAGSQVFSNLKAKHTGYLDTYKLTPSDTKSLLYMREDGFKSGTEEIVFKDFENSTPSSEVYYNIRLVPLYEGKGSSTQSSFYIVAEKKSAAGKVLSRFVAGNPEISRKGVVGYTIDRIYTSPDGKGFVFVVEKTVADKTGISIRYMVETVMVPREEPTKPASPTVSDTKPVTKPVADTTSSEPAIINPRPIMEK